MFPTAFLTLVLAMPPVPDILRTDPSGVEILSSQHDVGQTVDRLEALLTAHGARIFARIDFAADAAKAGLSLRPEQLLIFGNPAQGTPLLQSSATVGLDLPLKALVWQDDSGAAHLAYNASDYILSRHQVPAALKANIDGVVALMRQAVQ